MSASVASPTPIEEANDRLINAHEALSTLLQLLSVDETPEPLQPRGVRQLLAPIEQDVYAALDEISTLLRA